MKFNEAYDYAMKHSVFFRHHDEQIKMAKKKNESTGCLVFRIGSECFSYGYDGVKLHKVKHTDKRSEHLIATGEALDIDE